MSQADFEDSARNPDVSEIEGDEVALNVIGPDTERPKSRKLKYFLIFLLFQLAYTYILFVVFFSPKAADNLGQPQTSLTSDPSTPTLPKTETPSTGTVTNPTTENPTTTAPNEPSTTPTTTPATNPSNPTTTTPNEPSTTPTTTPATNPSNPITETSSTGTGTNSTTENPGGTTTNPTETPSTGNGSTVTPVVPTEPSTTPTTPTTPAEPSTTPTTSQPTGPVLDFTKVATLIDTREDSRLVPIILHFASVLGDDWPFKIFYSQANKHFFDNSVSIQKYVKSGRFELIQLPSNAHFGSRPDVTAFLTKKDFWEQLAPAEHVLMFQLDSIICANSPKTADEFLQYDWIGAPWNENGGGNGGLSIRNRKKMLQVIEKWTNNPYFEAEDTYFWSHLKELPNPVMPTFETSKQFSVELVYNEKPLGYHQPYRYWPSKINEIEAYCPEVKLTTHAFI